MRSTLPFQSRRISFSNATLNGVSIVIFAAFVVCLLVAGFHFQGAASAQVNGCTNLSSDQGKGTQTISLTNAGTYSVWARVKSDDNQPQYKFSIDGVGGKLCDQTVNASFGNSGWGWVKAPNTLTWSGGSGRLQVAGTKANVGLDCVVVTRNSSFSPSTAADCRQEPASQPISITAPLSFQVVSGTVTITAEPSASISVSRVRFFVNGVAVGAPDNTAPYSTSWNSTTVPSGTHNLTARVVTTSGETFTSTAVSVIVNNAPTDTLPPITSITSIDGRIVGAPSTVITATASDNLAVNRVELRRVSDNLVLATDTEPPYEFSIPTGIDNGDYAVKAVAYDNSNNQGSSPAKTIRLRLPDLNRDGNVEIDDLTQLLNKWRTDSIPEDLSGNGMVDSADLALLLGRWGSSLESLDGFSMDTASEEAIDEVSE